MVNGWREHRVAVVVAIVLAVATATGAPWWWEPVTSALSSRSPTVPVPSSSPSSGPPSPGVISFGGGCEPFQVFAQNRWTPLGAAVRTAPSVLAHQLSGYDSNHSIAVDGWVHGSAPYTTNQPPFNSNVWFHIADGSGWVSFAGVRAVPTSPDPTNLSPNGGQPAPTLASCQGFAQ